MFRKWQDLFVHCAYYSKSQYLSLRTTIDARKLQVDQFYDIFQDYLTNNQKIVCLFVCLGNKIIRGNILSLDLYINSYAWYNRVLQENVLIIENTPLNNTRDNSTWYQQSIVNCDWYRLQLRWIFIQSQQNKIRVADCTKSSPSTAKLRFKLNKVGETTRSFRAWPKSNPDNYTMDIDTNSRLICKQSVWNIMDRGSYGTRGRDQNSSQRKKDSRTQGAV